MFKKLRELFHFFGDGKERKASIALKDKVIAARQSDIDELKTINRNVKLLLDEGSIEIIVRNVRGVIHEDYGKKKRK